MLIMLIMMELRLGQACGKVNIIHIKNVILVHVIIFLTEGVVHMYMFVCFHLLFLVSYHKHHPLEELLMAALVVVFVLRNFSLTSCCVYFRN